MKGTLVTAGMITGVRELITKKGDKMAFLILAPKKSFEPTSNLALTPLSPSLPFDLSDPFVRRIRFMRGAFLKFRHWEPGFPWSGACGLSGPAGSSFNYSCSFLR